jgi:hypothetical protein
VTGFLPGLDAFVYLGIVLVMVGTSLTYVLSKSSPGRQSLAAAGLILTSTLLVVPAATFPYLLVPVATGVGLLTIGSVSQRTKTLLTVGLLICGVPLNLQDLVVVLPTTIEFVGSGLGGTLLTAVPPYLLGGVVLAVGHATAALEAPVD